MRQKYEKGGMGYKEAKELLIKDLSDFIKPMRERREALAKNPAKVLKIIKEGGKRVGGRIDKKMKEVREKVGVEVY